MAAGGARSRIGAPSRRKSVPWYTAGKNPELQFLPPPTTSPASVRMTKVGRLLFAVPSPYVTHAPMDGRPARIEPVFIWHTDPTWFNPSAQQERNSVISSTCCAMVGYQSDTHMPLSPYCFQVRDDGISVLEAVPIAVITFPN